MRHTDTLKRLNSVMKDINDDCSQVLRELQDEIDYLLEKVAIYEEIIEKETGKSQPVLTRSQKRRLAYHGRKLNRYLLSTIEPTFAPSTIHGWYRELVCKKYDSSKVPGETRGRKPISQEIIEMTLRIQKKNPDWGYDRIAGVLQYLHYEVSATTVRKILNDHGIVPDPERRTRGDWQRFINAQRHLIAATDFTTVERVTEYGLIREHLLFFINHSNREVRLGGICRDPNSRWTTQVARHMCDMFDGFLLGKKYLIHDRDPLFNKPFDAIFESIGIEIKRLPPFTPMMNAHCEGFMRALKLECLDKLIFTTRAQLRVAVSEYLDYWNHYRPHKGLDGGIAVPLPQDPKGEVVEVPFLGGLFYGYRREIAA